MPIELTTATETQKTNIRDALAAAKDVAFVGAAADAIGQKGIVPQPQIGDQDKYLRGNGTWSGFGAIPAIGGVTPNSGAFTSLSASGNTTVGGTLQVTGLVTGTAGFSGSLTGNVTGNVAGNVTGNVTGDLNGQVGNTTPNAGAFTTLSANNGTITTSSPAFTLAQTWNAAGTTFTALRVNATDTASASGSLLMDLQAGGTSRFSVDKGGAIIVKASTGPTDRSITSSGGGTTGISIEASNNVYMIATNQYSVRFNRGGDLGCTLRSDSAFGITSGNADATPDTILRRDAADTFAQRRTTNAQTFRIYNTFTDASNYERGFFRWNTNVLEIGAEAAGTGTSRNIALSTGGSSRLTIDTSGISTFSGVVSLTASGTSQSTLRVGNFEFQPFAVNNCWLGDNVFYNGTAFVRRATGASGLFYFQGTEGQFRFASSGSAGTTFSASIMYKINISGEMGVGVSTNYNTGDFGGFGFYVAGNSGICAVRSNGTFAFTSSTTNANGTRDTAISRNAAGVLEVNSGTAGTFRDLIVRNFRMSSPTSIPATAGATGAEGDIKWDADYIYICTATNTWKRVAIATW